MGGPRHGGCARGSGASPGARPSVAGGHLPAGRPGRGGPSLAGAHAGPAGASVVSRARGRAAQRSRRRRLSRRRVRRCPPAGGPGRAGLPPLGGQSLVHAGRARPSDRAGPPRSGARPLAAPDTDRGHHARGAGEFTPDDRRPDRTPEHRRAAGAGGGERRRDGVLHPWQRGSHGSR